MTKIINNLLKKRIKLEKEPINVSSRTIITDNYYRKDMNHTISNSNHYLKANFDYAASTGSLYKHDIFENCSMYQTDFEYCQFENCCFSSKKKVVSSFNCSDFIMTSFRDINFKACTFTGTLFDNCKFDNVDIQSSTLENALFDNCSLKHMNLSRLNMSFAQFVNPKMDEVILSALQIPYIFGCMKYLKNTNDNIKISISKELISISQYFETEIFKLIEKWESQVLYDYKLYFPLANIYIALGNYNDAQKSLTQGITNAMSMSDYRMIKFYCKLISEVDAFDKNQRHKFYNLIKCFSNSNDKNISVQRSFLRNIAEIKSLLFSNSKKSNLKLKFLTNIGIYDSQKLQNIIEHIFSISKMKYKGFSNEVEITIAQNSPLTISIHVTSDEENIYYILNQLIDISNKTALKEILKDNILLKYCNNEVCNQTSELVEFCSDNSINLTILEYFLENITHQNQIPTCYFTSDNLLIDKL